MFVYHAAHLARDGINQIFILRRDRINKFNNKKSTSIHSQRMMCMTTVCLCIVNPRAEREIGWGNTEKDFKFIAIVIGVWSASFPNKDVLRDTEMRFVLLGKFLFMPFINGTRESINEFRRIFHYAVSTNIFSAFRTADSLQLTWPTHTCCRDVFFINIFLGFSGKSQTSVFLFVRFILIK